MRKLWFKKSYLYGVFQSVHIVLYLVKQITDRCLSILLKKFSFGVLCYISKIIHLQIFQFLSLYYVGLHNSSDIITRGLKTMVIRMISLSSHSCEDPELFDEIHVTHVCRVLAQWLWQRFFFNGEIWDQPLLDPRILYWFTELISWGLWSLRHWTRAIL